MEGLIEEIVLALAVAGIAVNGTNLANFVPISVSMPKLDVDALFYNEDDQKMLVFNTKFSNIALTGNTVDKFKRNIDALMERYPEVSVTIVHCALVKEAGQNGIVQSNADKISEYYWTLDDLILAMQPLLENVEIQKNSEDGMWLRRAKVEDRLCNWMKQTGVGSCRITGHEGNGKTVLVKKIGRELGSGGSLVLYFDLLRRIGYQLN